MVADVVVVEAVLLSTAATTTTTATADDRKRAVASTAAAAVAKEDGKHAKSCNLGAIAAATGVNNHSGGKEEEEAQHFALVLPACSSAANSPETPTNPVAGWMALLYYKLCNFKQHATVACITCLVEQVDRQTNKLLPQ